MGNTERGMGVRVARCVAATVACMLLGASSMAFAPCAYADGGVAVTSVAFQEDVDPQAVPCKDPAAYLLCVEFDKNVSYARDGQDDTFVTENLGRVHLRYVDGTDVENVRVYGAHDQGDRRLIYVETQGWMRPLTVYHVVVDAGVTAANGEDVLASEYVYEFKTDSSCSNGLSVYENVMIPAAVVLVAVGVAVQAVRVRRRRS